MPFSRRLPLVTRPFLDEGALASALPGLRDARRQRLFLETLERSQRFEAYRRSFAGSSGPTDPLVEGWHPWTAIASLAAGEREEAVWLAYLTTFFGPDERGRDTWRATRLVYSGFRGACLTFASVRDQRASVARLCRDNEAAFRALPRGNHRKYEPNSADHRQGLISSVDSLVALAARHGGLVPLVTAVASPRDRFERMMHAFQIISFGRTGRFDLLVLLGDLGVVELEAPRLFLKGATGPLKGARQALKRPGFPGGSVRWRTPLGCCLS